MADIRTEFITPAIVGYGEKYRPTLNETVSMREWLMKIVIIPDSYKESLAAPVVALAMTSSSGAWLCSPSRVNYPECVISFDRHVSIIIG